MWGREYYTFYERDVLDSCEKMRSLRAVCFLVMAPFFLSSVVSTRCPGGWVTHGIVPLFSFLAPGFLWGEIEVFFDTVYSALRFLHLAVKVVGGEVL